MAKTQILEITKSRAVKIFEDIGFQTANKWDSIRLQKKLMNLESLVEGTKLSAKGKKRVDEILQARSDGKEVVVTTAEEKVADAKAGKAVQDALKRETERKVNRKKKSKKEKEKVDVEENKSESKSGGKMSKSKKTAKKKIEKSTKSKSKTAAAKSKKEDAKDIKLDKFGSRVGTIQAKINSALTKKPKTMGQLLEISGVKNQQNGHLKNLINAGFVKKTEKGYTLL